MRSAWLIGLAAVFGMVTGCAAATQPHEHGIHLPPSGRGMSIALPLDAYSPTPEEQERADRAQAALERDCLSRFGLTWSGPDEATPLQGRAILAAQRAERFGLVDADTAARYGYHSPPWSPKAPQGKAEHHEPAQPPAQVTTVLFGQASEFGGKPVPAGGCRGESFRRLSTDAQQQELTATIDAALLPRLVLESSQRVAGDARISALSRAWSSCMARDGRRFATPQEAVQDKRWSTGDKPAAEETARLRAVKAESVARALGELPSRR
jgi:hypothetical protein